MNTAITADLESATEHRIADPNTLYVLVVDDSSSIRELVSLKLRELASDSLHLVIDLAESGEDAVAMAGHNVYDLVFMDVQMPGIGGLEACRRIKDIRPTRVAMLSAMTSGSDHELGHSAGCDNYLTKPPHDSDLRVILRLVSLKKMTQV